MLDFDSILFLSYLCYEMNNRQRYMLATLDYKKPFIHKFYQKLLRTSILLFCLFVICSSITVYLEVIDDIQF